jgi:hypothetical protein
MRLTGQRDLLGGASLNLRARDASRRGEVEVSWRGESAASAAELGYRSKPLWERFCRTGIISADQRHEAWTWTSGSGNTMHGRAGDWAVTDSAGNSWSVRDDIFRENHQHIGNNRWRRTAFVLARPARAGEIIDTLEGPATAADGDWIVRGENGEQWPVPAEQFRQRYHGPAPPG